MSNRKKLPRSRPTKNPVEWLDAVLAANLGPEATEVAMGMVRVAKNGTVDQHDLEDYFGLGRGDLDGAI